MEWTKNVVVSTRVRLARNLNGYPFPSHLSETQAKEIVRNISAPVMREEGFKLTYMSNVTESEAQMMMENHLISPLLIKNFTKSALLHNAQNKITIMINEEDHLREQCILSGYHLKEAYERVLAFDNKIGNNIKFAFDEQLGYLTACPTNIGTGMRASVMLFLPALTISGYMKEIINIVSHRGLTVRGIYGEGSQAEGYLYQVSNEITLGESEESILDLVHEYIKDIVEAELSERRQLIQSDRALDLKDQCMRSYGLIANCAKMSSQEFEKYATNVKLGICLGYLPMSDIAKIDQFMVSMKPSNINQSAGRVLTSLERDIYRAERSAKFFQENKEW